RLQQQQVVADFQTRPPVVISQLQQRSDPVESSNRTRMSHPHPRIRQRTLPPHCPPLPQPAHKRGRIRRRRRHLRQRNLPPRLPQTTQQPRSPPRTPNQLRQHPHHPEQPPRPQPTQPGLSHPHPPIQPSQPLCRSSLQLGDLNHRLGCDQSRDQEGRCGVAITRG